MDLELHSASCHAGERELTVVALRGGPEALLTASLPWGASVEPQHACCLDKKHWGSGGGGLRETGIQKHGLRVSGPFGECERNGSASGSLHSTTGEVRNLYSDSFWGAGAGQASVTYHGGQLPAFRVVCARSDEYVPLKSEVADTLAPAHSGLTGVLSSSSW